jgi:nucleoside-diphosphate-sugar epimerase
MKTIALTGATSMLGVALIKECIQNGFRVIAFVRPNSEHIKRLPKSDLIIHVPCDIGDMRSLPVNNLSADIFYHIAWSFTDRVGRNSPEKQSLNIKYTLDAVDLSMRLGCSRFIGTGSQAEYGRVSEVISSQTPVNPENSYGIAKYAAGKLSKLACKKLGIEHIWVRVFSVYGVNDNEATLIGSFIDKCKSNIPMQLTLCTQIWDYLYETDAGHALFLLGEKGVSHKVYCLGSGKGKPLRWYLEKICEIVNPEYQLNFGGIPFNDEQIMYLCSDIEDLKHDTGWSPEVEFVEGVKKMAESVL